MKLKAGVKKDGTLTALQFTCLGTGGAYSSGGVALVDFLIKDNYLCPNVECKSTDVYINAGLARPFRAPGHPQGSWALEQMLDQLAAAIEMDPLDLRLKKPHSARAARAIRPTRQQDSKNVLNRGRRLSAGEKGAKLWQKQSRRATSRRVSESQEPCGFAGGGKPPSTIVLKLFSDGSANLNMGTFD